MSCCTSISTIKNLTAHEELYLDYETSAEKLTWCSGCGNYGIQKALIRALTLEEYDLKDVLFCFDIGCNGNGSDKIGGYTVHGLHGRVLPLAAGAALANQNMKVMAMAGDGATFSEGVNHLVHNVRNDYPMLFILHNNENYGLTTGQASSMTRLGQKMNGTPDGVFVEPINACRFVLSLNPTFVARGFSGDQKHLTEIIRAGLNHKGFAFIEIMQLCPTYNKATSQEWFLDRIAYIDEKSAHDKNDIWAARHIVEDIEKDIALGVLYEREEQNFLERVAQRKGVKSALTEEVRAYGVQELMEAFV